MPGDERHTLCNTIVNLVKVARSHGADKEELADALGTSDSANILTDEGITAEISRLIENVQGREPSSSASIFDHGIEMMQLDPFRQFGPFFFTQTDHIELLHNHPSQLWPAAYWEATYHACALR